VKGQNSLPKTFRDHVASAVGEGLENLWGKTKFGRRGGRRGIRNRLVTSRQDLARSRKVRSLGAVERRS